MLTGLHPWLVVLMAPIRITDRTNRGGEDALRFSRKCLGQFSLSQSSLFSPFNSVFSPTPKERNTGRPRRIASACDLASSACSRASSSVRELSLLIMLVGEGSEWSDTVLSCRAMYASNASYTTALRVRPVFWTICSSPRSSSGGRSRITFAMPIPPCVTTTTTAMVASSADLRASSLARRHDGLVVAALVGHEPRHIVEAFVAEDLVEFVARQGAVPRGVVVCLPPVLPLT